MTKNTPFERSSARYLTLAPVTPKGKWQILSRRIGSTARYQVIAETRTELAAEQIVAALNSVNAVVLMDAAE